MTHNADFKGTPLFEYLRNGTRETHCYYRKWYVAYWNVPSPM